MKTEKKNKKERLEFFHALYESARDAYGDTLDELERNMAQYRGSTDIDGGREAALTVRNVTYEIIESQVSSDIPQPKADAAYYSEEKERAAMAIEALCRSLRDRLPFEEMNDLDERYTYIYGGSVWYVEWDNGEEHLGEVGAVKVHCISPRDFLPQPGIYSVRDMEYCFIRFTSTRGDVIKRYGISDEDITLADGDFEYATGHDDGDTVSLVICFWRDEDGEIGRYIFSGDLVLSDIPRYYMRKGEICPRCGSSRSCSCGVGREAGEIRMEIPGRDITLASGVVIPSMSPITLGGLGDSELAPTAIPYYTPKLFPIVIRKNTSSERSLFGQSDCDYIRPEQQAINKIESRILQKLLRAGVTPVVPEDATVSINNSVFGQVIKMKPGESISQYGKVDTPPDISQDIAEAERLYDHSKRILGISDALQGLDTAKNESGYARQLRISQATGRLESKRKMKHTAYADMDRQPVQGETTNRQNGRSRVHWTPSTLLLKSCWMISLRKQRWMYPVIYPCLIRCWRRKAWRKMICLS